MEGLPTYKITIDEAYNDGTEPLGVDAIAFTANPAVLVKGVAFKSQAKSHFADEKKYRITAPAMRITAPAMIPMDIYRRDDDMGEYYVQFSKDEIDTIFKDFMLNLNNRNLFNLEHEGDKIVPAYILEAWLVDNPEADKAKSTFGISVPEGTLMVTAQITDTDYYNKLVEAGQVGFSIEGFLGLKLSNQIKTNNMLPDGTHTLEDGTVIVIKDGQIVEVQEPMVEEQVMEVEASTEVEMADTTEVTEETVKEEVVEVEAAIDPAADTDAILAIVSPYIEQRISELLQVIADLKNELTETEEAAAKKYKFDLTVDASALLQANPSEYYSLLYGMENAVTNYRVLPGIKNKTKVATVVFDKVLAEAGCDFNAQNADVSAVEIDVCALTSQASVCQYDLEQSWLALEMAKGSNSDFSVASFMNFFWGQMAKKGHSTWFGYT